MSILDLDDKSIYVFIRQDLPLVQQSVQACHALFLVAKNHLTPEQTGHPNIILIGVADEKALSRAVKKLSIYHIPYCEFHEPDVKAYGKTAIATCPLDNSEREILKAYRLYSPCVPIYPGVTGFNAEGRANAAVAQLREHSVSNGEVEGANPSGGSKSLPCAN